MNMIYIKKPRFTNIGNPLSFGENSQKQSRKRRKKIEWEKEREKNTLMSNELRKERKKEDKDGVEKTISIIYTKWI